jgi:DNA-binding MarR family transcriptional regulator
MAAAPSKIAADPVAGREATVIAWRRLLQAVRRRERVAERETGLTGAQLLALRQLAAHPGSTMGELARLTATDASSISVVVSRLLEKGVASRVRDPLDQRRWRLQVTREGLARLKRAPASADLLLVGAIAALPVRRRAELARQLEGLAEAVEGAGVNGERDEGP